MFYRYPLFFKAFEVQILTKETFSILTSNAIKLENILQAIIYYIIMLH